MARLVWDQTSKRLYETGVKKGVIYPMDADGNYPEGVAWNGLTAVTESPSGAETSDIYADDYKYLSLMSTEDFGLTVEAYTYPDEFAECDGSAFVADGSTIGQQTRKTFGFCYRTVLGNDTQSEDYGYKIHIIFGCKASPSDKGYNTINDSPDALNFSWEFNSNPVEIAGMKPTSYIIVDSTLADAGCLSALEDILYGTDDSEPRMPFPDEITDLFSEESRKTRNLLDSDEDEILDSDGKTIQVDVLS